MSLHYSALHHTHPIRHEKMCTHPDCFFLQQFCNFFTNLEIVHNFFGCHFCYFGSILSPILVIYTMYILPFFLAIIFLARNLFEVYKGENLKKIRFDNIFV